MKYWLTCSLQGPSMISQLKPMKWRIAAKTRKVNTSSIICVFLFECFSSVLLLFDPFFLFIFVRLKAKCNMCNALFRSFQHSCLARYPGLAYSPSEDGTLCLNCMLFVSDNKEHGDLIKTPFRYWKDAISAFDNHFHNVRSDRTERARGYETHQKCCAKAGADPHMVRIGTGPPFDR